MGLINYFKEIFNQIEFPVFLYNMPQVTQVKITGKVIKESTGKWEETKYYIESFPNLHVFVGNDTLFSEALKIGAGGSITAVANTFPGLLVEVFDSFQKKIDMTSSQKMLTTNRKVLQKFSLQAATKYVLQLLGLAESTVRPPLLDLSELQKRKLKYELEKLDFKFYYLSIYKLKDNLNKGIIYERF